MNYKKLFVGLAVVALIFGITSVSAKAATIEELLAQIALLQAQLNQMQGGGGGGSAPLPPLTVGSTGEGVRSLQQWLNGHGFTVAASGPGSTGMESTYFGALTQAAVARFQVANGITPAAGYYGNITYNAVLSMGGDSGGGGSSGKAQCADGIDNDSDGKIDGFDTDGCTSMDDDSELAGGGNSGQGDGTLVSFSLALEGSPANGTDLTIGTTKTDIVKWKIKTSGDDGVLRQFGIKFEHRAWLYARAARLLIDGVVVAEKTGLTSADFQEVTSGTDYRLIFANLNHPLPLNKDVYVVLQVDAVSDTSRSTASGLVVDQATNSVVVADADDGYTTTDGVTTDRTYDFVSANTGNIVPSNSPVTPGSRWLKVTDGGTTPGVTMQVFKVKAEQKDVEINTVTISASSSGETMASLITGWDLYEGSCPTDGDLTGCTALAGGAFTAGSPTSGGTVAFSSLHVNIPVGTEKTFTIKALYADEDDYDACTANAADACSYASTTVMANATGFTAVDLPTFNTATISGGNVSGSVVHAILVAPTLSGVSMSLTQHSSIEYIANMNGSFSLTADGGSLYISQNPATAFATTTNGTMGGANATSTGVRSMIANSCSSCGDDSSFSAPASDYFVIPSGQTRTFTLTGDMNNLANGVPTITAGTKNFQVTNIYFGTASDALTGFNFDTTFTGMSELNRYVFLDTVDRN